MTIDECLSSDVECRNYIGMVKGGSRQRENGNFIEWSSIFKLATYTTWVPLSSFRAARQTGTCNHIPSSQRLVSRAWSQGPCPWDTCALANGPNGRIPFLPFDEAFHPPFWSALLNATTPVALHTASSRQRRDYLHLLASEAKE